MAKITSQISRKTQEEQEREFLNGGSVKTESYCLVIFCNTFDTILLSSNFVVSLSLKILSYYTACVFLNAS